MADPIRADMPWWLRIISLLLTPLIGPTAVMIIQVLWAIWEALPDDWKHPFRKDVMAAVRQAPLRQKGAVARARAEAWTTTCDQMGCPPKVRLPGAP